MSSYADLRARLEAREVIILDGAIGTQLQHMEVPLSRDAWAAIALETHPFTVRRLHELYIEAGVDVITTNTYSSARHNLLPLGLGDKVHELNLRAVMLAQDARDRAAKERPVWIGGSVSNYGLMAGAELGWADYQYFRDRVETSENQGPRQPPRAGRYPRRIRGRLPHCRADRQHRAAPMGVRSLRRDRPAGMVRIQVPSRRRGRLAQGGLPVG